MAMDSELDALRDRARAASRDRDWQRAESLWSEVASRVPGVVEPELMRAEALAGLERFGDAVALCEGVRQRFPEHRWALVLEARVLSQTAVTAQEWQVALSRWSDVCARFPENVSHWVALGRAEEVGGSSLRATQAYEQGLLRQPEDEHALRALSQLELSSGQLDAALTHARRLVTAHPLQGSARAMLARALLAADRLDDAADCIRRALDDQALHDDLARVATHVTRITGDRSLAWHAYVSLAEQGAVQAGSGVVSSALRGLRSAQGDPERLAGLWRELDHGALLAVSPWWHAHLAAASRLPHAVDALVDLALREGSGLTRDQHLALASGLSACWRFEHAIRVFTRAGLDPLGELPTRTVVQSLAAARATGHPLLFAWVDAVLASNLPARRDAAELRNVLGGLLLDSGEPERWLRCSESMQWTRDVIQLRATALILLGRAREGLEALEAFHRDHAVTPTTLAVLARAAHALGSRNAANRAVAELVERRPDLARLRGPRALLERLDDRPITPAPGEVSVVLVARDELVRLTWLLPYYRRLGVARFLVIDNASTDGTLELLRSQPDVHVFSTRDSYVEAHNGLRWSNQISVELLEGHWVLTVDADEALVYPDCEAVSLPDFCRKLETEGAEGMFAPMVDLYARSDDGSPLRPGDDLLARTPYFDPGSYRKESMVFCPYVRFQGGPRLRVMWDDHVDPLEAIPPAMSKVPLVKWLPGTMYFHSTHEVSPLALARTTGALLHFKLLPDAVHRAGAQAASFSGNHTAWERQTAYYLERTPATGFFDERSVRYESSATLERLGLMTRGTPRRASD